jgi:hypothetical protein
MSNVIAEMYPATEDGVYMETEPATADATYAEVRGWAEAEGWTYATVEGGHAELWDGESKLYMVLYATA